MVKSYLVTVDEAEKEIDEAEVEEEDSSQSDDEAENESSSSLSDDAAEEPIEEELELTNLDCETITPDLRNRLSYFCPLFSSSIYHDKLSEAQSNQVQRFHQIQ